MCLVNKKRKEPKEQLIYLKTTGPSNPGLNIIGVRTEGDKIVGFRSWGLRMRGAK